MQYDLKRPCPHCPFRTDIVQPVLSPAHASKVKGMVRAILEDGLTFACHKTSEVGDDGTALETDEVQFCAGAMILLQKLGRSTTELREAARAGQYDPSALDLDSPVYDSMEQMLSDMERATYGTTPASGWPAKP